MSRDRIVHQFIKNFETKQAAADYLEISRHALARILRAEDAGRERKLSDKLLSLIHAYKPEDNQKTKTVAPVSKPVVPEAISNKAPNTAPVLTRKESSQPDVEDVVGIQQPTLPSSFLQIFKDKDYMGTDILFRMARYPGVIFMVSVHGKRRALRARFFGSMDSVLIGSLPDLPENKNMTPMDIVTDAIQRTRLYASVERELNKLPLLDGSLAPKGPDRIYKTLLQIDELRGHIIRAHIANCISLQGFDWINNIILKLKGRLA